MKMMVAAFSMRAVIDPRLAYRLAEVFSQRFEGALDARYFCHVSFSYW
jgi:hypothetical protein